VIVVILRPQGTSIGGWYCSHGLYSLASPVLRLGNESAALILYTPVTAHPEICVEAQGGVPHEK
jgi:hypothetical protein